MGLLLDTHAFLWWVAGSPTLASAAREAIRDPEVDCWVSLASCWEISIKHSLGKLRVPAPLEHFISEQMAANGFRQLGIDFRHVVGVAALPFHHRDPFDRLLVAQATAEGLTVVSADPAFDAYGVTRLW